MSKLIQNWRERFYLGDCIQTARLLSGLILFSFVFTHFANHAVGIFSEDLIIEVQELRTAWWRSIVGSVLLYGALLCHIVLGVYKLLNRKHWRMPPWEWIQIVLALFIPYWLGKHIIATRGTYQFFGHDDNYFSEISLLWPGNTLTQNLLLLVVWAHSMIGLHYWLRLFRGYERLFPWLLGFAVTIPLMAMWGWMNIAQVLEAYDELDHFLDDDTLSWMRLTISQYTNILIGLCVVIITILTVQAGKEFLSSSFDISYVAGPTVKAKKGQTLLEVSRSNGIPHTSVCGGRARCSTCRVQVVSDDARLPPADENEERVLRRIKAPKNVRLACQLIPNSDITVRPLIDVNQKNIQNTAQDMDAYHWGVERYIAILFCDLRGFTAMSENRLSYDVVFLLNRYHQKISVAIESADGHIDKYIGDGIMAIFGVHSSAEKACQQSINAVEKMMKAMQSLNDELGDVEQPLRIGIGVHAGNAILGRIGASGHHAAGITALGDIVNTASRLESATKDHGVQALLSKDVFETAGLSTDLPWIDISVRGRTNAISALAVTNAKEIGELN